MCTRSKQLNSPIFDGYTILKLFQAQLLPRTRNRLRINHKPPASACEAGSAVKRLSMRLARDRQVLALKNTVLAA